MGDATRPGPETEGYPWYRLVTGGSVEQGELFLDFPVVTVLSSYEEIVSGSEEADQSLRTFDTIVVSQSCDLDAGKIETVVLCPIHRREEIEDQYGELRNVGGLKRIKAGWVASLYMLPPCRVEEFELGSRYVSFRQVFAVPLAHVQAHARRYDRRVRLMPPYREHLAQAFARFIMRIGFPVDFEAVLD